MEELSNKKEKLEADKAQLLASVRAETQGLQEEKEKLQAKLAELKKSVNEKRTAVCTELRRRALRSHVIFVAVKLCRIRIKIVHQR